MTFNSLWRKASLYCEHVGGESDSSSAVNQRKTQWDRERTMLWSCKTPKTSRALPFLFSELKPKPDIESFVFWIDLKNYYLLYYYNTLTKTTLSRENLKSYSVKNHTAHPYCVFFNVLIHIWWLKYAVACVDFCFDSAAHNDSLHKTNWKSTGLIENLRNQTTRRGGLMLQE